MADLKFTVEAQYQQLLALRKEIQELEKDVQRVNRMIVSPNADVSKLTADLQALNQKIGNLSSQAAAATAQLQTMGNTNVNAKVSAVGVAARGTSASMRDLSSATHEANQSFDSISQGVGGFVRQFGVAALTVKGLQEALGLLKGSLSTITSFQSANSTLQAILNATDEQMQGFKATAEELGRTTVFTATQVTELQTALSKLGFDSTAIHAMEADILHFAQATGAALDEAASTTGAALRMFGVKEDEYEEKAKQFTNAMATATMRSALDFRMIRDNLATFGPMAHSMGLEIEDVLALFGKLKDSGVEASTAMTSLRNIFTKVAQGKIEGMGEVHSLEDFVNGLKNMGKLDPGSGMKMIGPRGGTQFITLKEQAEEILALRNKIAAGMNEDTTGAMGEKMVKNLSGQLKMLESAWQGFVLTFQESDGIAKEFVASLTDGITKFRELIASEGDWDKETIEGYIDAAKALLAIIAVYKAEMLVVAGVEKARSAWNATMSQQQIAHLNEVLALKGKEAAAEGAVTAETKAHIVALQAQLQTQREIALAASMNGGGTTTQHISALESAKMQVKLIQQQIAETQKLISQKLEEQALAENANKTSLAQKRLKEAELLIEKQKTLEMRKQAALNGVMDAEDSILVANGHDKLQSWKLGTAELEKQIGKTSKLKTAMSMLGLDMLTNPYVLLAGAITAVGYATYKVATANDAATIAQQQYAEAVDETKTAFDNLHNEVNNNLSILRDETTTTLQKVRAYKDLVKQYKELAKYSPERLAKMSKEEINTLLNNLDEEKMQQRLERQYQVLQNVIDKFQDVYKTSGGAMERMSADAMQGFVTNHFGENSDEVRIITEMMDKLDWSERGKGGEVFLEFFRQAKAEYQSLQKDIADAQDLEAEKNDFVRTKAKENWETQRHAAEDYYIAAIEAQDKLAAAMEKSGRSSIDYVRAENEVKETIKRLQKELDAELEKVKNIPEDKRTIDVKAKISTLGETIKWLQQQLQQISKDGTASLDVKLKAIWDIQMPSLPKFSPQQLNWGQPFGGQQPKKDETPDPFIDPAAYKARIEEEKRKKQPKKTNNDTGGHKVDNADAQNAAKAAREQQERYEKTVKENNEKRAELVKQAELDIANATINAMQEGEKKILAQMSHTHDAEIAKIEKDTKAKKDAWMKMRETEFNQSPSNQGQKAKNANDKKKTDGQNAVAKKTFNREWFEKNDEETIAYFAQLEKLAEAQKYLLLFNEQTKVAKKYQTQTQKDETGRDEIKANITYLQEQIAQGNKQLEETLDDKTRAAIVAQVKALNAALAEAQRQLLDSEEKNLNDFLSKYGSYAQQRAIIDEKYNRDMERAGGDKAKLASLTEQHKKDVSSLDAKAISEKIDWANVFGDTGKALESVLRPTLEQLQEYVKTDDFRKRDAASQKEIVGAISRIRKAIGDTKLGTKGLSDAMSAYQNALKEGLPIIEEDNRLRKELEELDAKAASSEGLTEEDKKRQKEIRDQLNNVDYTTRFNNAKNGISGTTANLAQQFQNFKTYTSKRTASISSLGGEFGLSQIAELSQAFDSLKGGLQGLKAYNEEVRKRKEQERQASQETTTQTEKNQKAIEGNTEANTNASESANGAADALEKVQGGAEKMAEGVEKGAKGVEGLADTGKVVSKAVGDAFADAGFIGQIVAAILKILDILKDGIGTLIEGILTSIGNAVEGILKNIFSGEMFVQVFRGVGNLVRGVLNGITLGGFNALLGSMGVFGADYSEYEKALEKYSNLVDVWGEVLDEQKKQLSEAKGTYQSIQAYYDSLSTNDRLREAAKAIAEARLGSGASMGSHSMRYRMWDGSYVSAEGRTWHDVNQQIAANYGVQFNDMSDLLNMNSETLQKIKVDYADLWAAMDGDFREQMENIIKYGETEGDLLDELNQKLTGTSFDEMVSSFESGLLDMNKMASDFSNDFSEMMAKAMLNAQFEDLYADDVKKLYDDMAKMMKDNNGKLSEANVEALREQYNAIVQGGIALRDQVAEVTGYDQSSNEAEATRNSAKQMSEDTANALVGIMTAQRIATEGSLLQSQLQTTALQEMYAMLNTPLSDFAEGQSTTNIALGEIQTILADTYISVVGIKDNTDNMLPSLRAMANDISELKDTMKSGLL